jgi:predicted RNase H-like nuclease (RuvC/YqgF family)
VTDLERENRRLQGELIRAREEITELRERLAYAHQQIRDLSARLPRREMHST